MSTTDRLLDRPSVSAPSIVTNPGSSLDERIHQRYRLAIAAIAYEEGTIQFSFLQKALKLSPGNLSGHLRVLEEANLIATRKTFEERRPVTYIELTEAGRRALHAEVQQLKEIVGRIEAANVAVTQHSSTPG